MTILPNQSPQWNRYTKAFVATAVALLLALAVWRFQEFLQPLLAALILAYVLDPFVEGLARRLRIGRTVALALVYVVFLIILLSFLSMLGVVIYQQAQGLVALLPNMLANLPRTITGFIDANPVYKLGPVTLDIATALDQAQAQLVQSIQPLLSQSGQLLGGAATSVVAQLGWLFLVLVLSIYIARDFPKLSQVLHRLSQQSGHRDDVEALLNAFSHVWQAYLRGQAALCISIGVVTGIFMLILDVRYALILGVIGGVLEFVPYIGPVISVALAILVALFQDSNWFGVDPFTHGLMVMGVGILIQQVENNVFVPRIMGGSLNLHPVIVMIGALMGGSLAGILGVMLSAPILATGQILVQYTWHKMLDLPPFPPPAPRPPAAPPFLQRVFRAWRAFWAAKPLKIIQKK
jgi:predicted PurR-regulated permease PerM